MARRAAGRARHALPLAAAPGGGAYFFSAQRLTISS